MAALLAALAVLAATAAAQTPPRVDQLTAEAPPPIRPGETADTTVLVHYCYGTAPAVPGTVEASVDGNPSWASATLSPSSFSADTSGGQRCGSRSLGLTITVTRAAPAYAPEFVQLSAVGRGSGTSSNDPAETQVPVQADYWAEVSASQAERPRVPRADIGTVRLELRLGANGGTRVEITGGDAQGLLSVLGKQFDAPGGEGLDEPETRTVDLRVAVSPGSALGVQRVPIHITTVYAQRPDIAGEAKDFEVQVNVLEASGGGTPGPEVGLVLGAVLVLGWAWARRAR
jgi:hypothetical protein